MQWSGYRDRCTYTLELCNIMSRQKKLRSFQRVCDPPLYEWILPNANKGTPKHWVALKLQYDCAKIQQQRPFKNSQNSLIVNISAYVLMPKGSSPEGGKKKLNYLVIVRYVCCSYAEIRSGYCTSNPPPRTNARPPWAVSDDGQLSSPQTLSNDPWLLPDINLGVVLVRRVIWLRFDFESRHLDGSTPPHMSHRKVKTQISPPRLGITSAEARCLMFTKKIFR